MAKIELKKPVVEEISANIEGAQSVVLVQYCGLTVEQDTRLRKELRDNGVIYKVYKNTMMNFAFKGTDCESLAPQLEGPNAIAISKTDATAPARILAKFGKEAPALEIKGGIVEVHTTTQLAWLRSQRFRQEKSFLASCLAASSLRLQTLLAF